MLMFFPCPRYTPHLHCRRTVTLSVLCQAAGVSCRATGLWTERPVEVVVAVEGARPSVEAQPGLSGAVRVTTPVGLNEREAARYALAALAYALFDLVARQSIRGAAWARPTLPKGRARSGQAKSNAVRQRAFRARKLNPL